MKKKQETRDKKQDLFIYLLHKVWPYLLLFLPILIFFFPVWGQGMNAIPADTLTGLYHPYRDVVVDEYPNGTPFKNFLITDSVKQQYVYRQFSIDQLKQGKIPWWNPYNFSGTPHVAAFQAASFYPLNIVFWFFSFTSGWNLLVMGQMFFGVVFMYWYLRSLKLLKLASVFGALTFIFSGFFVVWLEWNTAAWVVVWSPLVLLSMDKLILLLKDKNDRASKETRGESQESRYLWSGLLCFSLVCQFYAGYPQPWLYLSIFQGAYALWRLISHLSNLSDLRKKIVPLAISYLVFAALAFPQLKATLDLSSLSNRDIDQGVVLDKADWFIPYEQLIQMIVPDFFGNPATLNYWGVFNYTEFVTFVGVIPFFFVLLSLANFTKKKETRFFFGAVIVALLFSLRNPIGLLPFTQQWPFLGGSQPSRLIVILCLSLPVLSAFGFNNWYKKESSHRYKTVGVLMAVFAVLWTLIFKPDLASWTKLGENISVAKRNLLLPTIELFFLAGALILSNLGQLKSLKYRQLSLGLFLILATTFVGLRFATKFTPFTNPDQLYPESKILSYLQENQGLSRYMTTDDQIMPANTNMAYGLYTIEGYDPLYTQSYGDLIYATQQNDQWPEESRGYNRTVTTNEYNSDLIDLLGVKHVLTFNEIDQEDFVLIMEEGKTKLYENKNVYPKAFVIPTLDQKIPDTYSEATVEMYRPNKVVVQTTTDSEAVLILADAWYPNWQATIDGKEVEVINWYGLRATILPEGTHEIIYKYSHTNI